MHADSSSSLGLDTQASTTSTAAPDGLAKPHSKHQTNQHSTQHSATLQATQTHKTSLQATLQKIPTAQNNRSSQGQTKRQMVQIASPETQTHPSGDTQNHA
jgi:hypothetical protein